MNRALSVSLVALGSFVLGAAAARLYDSRHAAATPPSAVAAATPIDFASEPLWAYGFTTVRHDGEEAAPQNPPARRLRPNEPAADQTRPRTVPGSRAHYSLLDVRDDGNLIDWFPEDHPTPMPAIIAHGPARTGDRKWSCASCHLPNGLGRPENAPPGGLPVAYFIRQLQDFRSGARRSAGPRKPNTNTMIALAKA